jgi:hypothetical protein
MERSLNPQHISKQLRKGHISATWDASRWLHAHLKKAFRNGSNLRKGELSAVI